MAGAMAGSAILDFRCPSDRLRLVTLTVNNACNLRCPHCYLHYGATDSFVAPDVIDRVVESSCAHVAIVGKEALVNDAVAFQTFKVLEQSTRQGKSVSLITNGLGLHLVPPEVSALLAFIDVSLDGGPATYQAYRRASYEAVVRKMARHVASGFRRFRVLSVLSTANLDSLDDILLASEIDGVSLQMLSPYVVTRNDGRNSVSPVPMTTLLGRLGSSRKFRDSSKTVLLLARTELEQLGADLSLVKAKVAELDLAHRVILLDDDPLKFGLIRVTYDGWALTPLQSIHTTDYRSNGIPVRTAPLDEIFATLRGDGVAVGCGHGD